MKHTQSSNCLQVPAVKALPQSMSRLILDLEVTYYPSICSNSCIQNKPAQMACPLAWTPVWTKLTTYNGSLIPLYEILHGPILWQPNTPGAQPHIIHSYWYIADMPGPVLLGLPTCKKLAVVQVNCAVKTTQPDRSPLRQQEQQNHPPQEHWSPSASNPLMTWWENSLIDSLESANSQVNIRYDYVHLVIHAPRKCPITLRPKVKEHLLKMEALGVITHIDQPTDWVLSITYIQKANGELHLCLDPCDLNRAICHDHHKMPTVEEVAHKFANSHFFTKLDAHHGYWSIVLDEESSLLTTFNSPFGRYHFLHLPFGLVCSQDIIQKKMEQILEECPRWIWIADDITIHGCTEAEHDAHLHNLMQVACKYGVVFNPQKMHVKAPDVNFFGCLYDANGVHSDPEKVDAVHALPAPTNVTELQEFLSMVTYLSPFICGLSTLTACLWELLKKDTSFTWNASYETTFEQIKQAIVSDTTIRYFNPSLPVTIQVDASQVGLGAALLQNNKPIAFTSKALTDAEHRYANIEREMLAVVFGAELFHTYVYGWSFMIESDHKLLESISRKNLADMPAGLQCMMLHLQGYDLTICYHPGKEMVIPDTLSWFSPWPGPDFPLDIAIHHACIMPTCKEAFQQAFVNDKKWELLLT